MLKPPEPYNVKDYCDCDVHYICAMGECVDMSLTAIPIVIYNNVEICNIYLNNCLIGKVVIIHSMSKATIIPVVILGKTFETFAVEVQDYEDDWNSFPPPTYKQLIKALLWGCIFSYNEQNLDINFVQINKSYKLDQHISGDMFSTDSDDVLPTQTSALVNYIMKHGRSTGKLEPTEYTLNKSIISHVPVDVENSDLLIKWLDTTTDTEVYGQYGIPHLMEMYGADFIMNKDKFDPARISHRVLKLQSEMKEDGLHWYADIECIGEMGPQLKALAEHQSNIKLKVRGCRTIVGSEELITEPVALDVYTEVELFNRNKENRKEGHNE